jgi:hypothetical protein
MPAAVPHPPKFDVGFLQVDSHTVPVSRSVSLRIYRGTEPHNWKIADLQKGLILVINGTETVGEGAGFGLPVLMYAKETYFSGTSKVHVSRRNNNCCIIRKEFTMDRMARNSFKNVTLENHAARSLITHLSDLYQKHRRFRLLTLKDLTARMSISKVFLEARPIGKVTVTYTVDTSRITVRADFNGLKKRMLQKTLMLNEQGSKFFNKFTRPQGTELTDSEIGAWEEIRCEWACLKTPTGRHGFRLWRTENSILRRGREFLEGSLDWAGLDYEVTPGNDVFEYTIDLLGAER